MNKNISAIAGLALSVCLALTGCGSVKTGASADAGGNSTPAPAKPAWQIVLETKITHKSNYEGFLNEKLGFTVGYNGEIHYTRDGAATWPQGQNNSHCRFGLDIVNDKIAWAVGNYSNVRYTVDGGENWIAAKDVPTSGSQNQVSFIDDKTGWVASDTKLFATTDSAATWNKLTLPEGVKLISSIFLRSATEGYVLNSDGTLFITADGGASWNKLSLPFKDTGMANGKGQEGMLNDTQFPNARVTFTDANHGIVAIICTIPKKGYQTWLFETSDGGATWSSNQLNPKEGYMPTNIFLTRDGQYMTLSSTGKEVVVVKRQ
ncbi:MAG: hypothetical protein N2376_03650 [Clostridia bacterium]|nr:hypothetical protein [Clostridia bacterium]